MAAEIHVKQTLPIRARPEILYRLVMDPHRRAAWDSHLDSAAYEGEATRLTNHAVVNFKYVRRLLGLKVTGRYSHLQTSQRGTWESLKPVGPLEKMRQQWNFKAMPGGTEVTLTLDATVRYNWARAQIERVLQNMVVTTMLDLQRQVDAPGARLVEDLGREEMEKQKAAQKAAKEAAKTARRRK